MPFFYILVIVAIVAVGFYLLKQKSKDINDPANTDNDTEDDPSPEYAKRGDVIIFEGVTVTYGDISLTVDRINRYQDNNGYTWKEFSGIAEGKRQHVEYHYDDEPYITMCTDDDISLSELGVDEEFLGRIDDQGDFDATVEYKGVTYRFKESGEVHYFKDDKDLSESYWSWDFVSVDDSKKSLYVEKYDGEDFEVGLTKSLTPSLIKVYSV